MIELTGLPHLIRALCVRGPNYAPTAEDCADMIETALPTWKEITKLPDSWPKLDPEYGVDEIEVVARFPNDDGKLGSIEAFIWDVEVNESIMDGDRLGYIGGRYREACGIDRPPPEQS